MGRNCTLLSAPTMAKRAPSWRKSMAFTGTVTFAVLILGEKCTSPKEPRNRRPSLLGTSTSVSSVGGARHRSSELLLGNLLQRDIGLHSILDGGGVGLRNVSEYAHWINLGKDRSEERRLVGKG